MHKTFFVAATLIACCLEAHAEDFAFAYPPPSNASAMKTVSLWSTQYLIHSAQAKPPSPDTVELKRRDGTGFGIHLQRRDWCNAVMEGTVSVAQNNTISTFNVDGPVKTTFTGDVEAIATGVDSLSLGVEVIQ